MIFNILILLNLYSYKLQAEKVAQSYNNRPLSAIDTVLFWTENIINNDGSLIKSQASELNWFSYYCIDVVLALLSVLLAFILLVIRIFKMTIVAFKLSKSKKDVKIIKKKKK